MNLLDCIQSALQSKSGNISHEGIPHSLHDESGRDLSHTNFPEKSTRLLYTFEFMFPTWFVFLSPPSTILHTRFFSGLWNWAENEQERRQAQEKHPLEEAAANLLGGTLWLHPSVFDSKSFFLFIHCSRWYTEMQKERQRVPLLNDYAICFLFIQSIYTNWNPLRKYGK